MKLAATPKGEHNRIPRIIAAQQGGKIRPPEENII